VVILESTQPLIELSTRNLPGDKGRPEHKDDSTHQRHLSAQHLENEAASTSHNPMGLHGLLQERLYLFRLLQIISPLVLQ
jgi:hypothetical protein